MVIPASQLHGASCPDEPLQRVNAHGEVAVIRDQRPPPIHILLELPGHACRTFEMTSGGLDGAVVECDVKRMGSQRKDILGTGHFGTPNLIVLLAMVVLVGIDHLQVTDLTRLDVCVDGRHIMSRFLEGPVDCIGHRPLVRGHRSVQHEPLLKARRRVRTNAVEHARALGHAMPPRPKLTAGPPVARGRARTPVFARRITEDIPRCLHGRSASVAALRTQTQCGQLRRHHIETERTIGRPTVGGEAHPCASAYARRITQCGWVDEDDTTNRVRTKLHSGHTADHSDFTCREGIDLWRMVHPPFLNL